MLNTNSFCILVKPSIEDTEVCIFSVFSNGVLKSLWKIRCRLMYTFIPLLCQHVISLVCLERPNTTFFPKLPKHKHYFKFSLSLSLSLSLYIYIYIFLVPIPYILELNPQGRVWKSVFFLKENLKWCSQICLETIIPNYYLNLSPFYNIYGRSEFHILIKPYLLFYFSFWRQCRELIYSR